MKSVWIIGILIFLINFLAFSNTAESLDLKKNQTQINFSEEEFHEAIHFSFGKLMPKTTTIFEFTAPFLEDEALPKFSLEDICSFFSGHHFIVLQPPEYPAFS